MKYKIVVDSCGEIPEDLKKSGRFENVALELDVNGERIVDDETFDQLSFIKKVAESPTCPKSSCPSPDQYLTAYENGDAEHVYVVTLSEQLSGSYNSASLAKTMFEEKYPDRKIYVFNSRSASIGETLSALKVDELEMKGYSFEDIVNMTEDYIENMNTYFVLESLETLRKNGRLTGIKAFVATALNIKPVMGATPQGTIFQRGQARGVTKALKNMVRDMVSEVKDPENKILGISHCNCYERALFVKKLVEEQIKVKEVVIMDQRGVSSLYANDGGIIMSI